MSKYSREQLQQIKSFPQLVKYLQEELEWPITKESFDDLTFDYEPEELGIDSKTAAKIDQIKQLRPLVTNQPWGIFFIKFEPKRLPVVALRRILSQLVIKKRTSAKKSEQASWNLNDLLFISNYGDSEDRQITFAQFAIDEYTGGSPVLRVLGWDDADTALHIDHVHNTLKEKLHWPDDTSDIEGWRNIWSTAFILRHREVITTSKELAEALAKLAIRIRKTANLVMDIETEKGELRKLYKAFEAALIPNLIEDDFADMYAQTITYGLLAARVSRPMGIVSDNLSDMIPITNPFLKDMLDTFLNVGGRRNKIDFDELGIQDVVELLNNPFTQIDAILRDFGNKTRQEDPVIHFYEDFLNAYDKKKKVDRGVFYTPQPVVSFIVREVHELLQSEFGLEDGLADITTWGEMNKRNNRLIIPQGIKPTDPFIVVLDIATGTATFLVEVIDIIYKTMYAKWEKQGKNEKQIAIAWNEYVPKHLLPRLYGFELLMAPYAIAHMKIGLKLAETGYRFVSIERVHIYLTNTLEPDSKVTQIRLFSEALAKEANAVNQVKMNCHFSVVIGNPPYNRVSTNSNDFICNLIYDYKINLNERNLVPLDDDYIKFIRLGQHFINKNGEGILAYISNNSFIDGITHRQMRKNLIDNFDNIYILDLHGSVKKKETTPDGSLDQNVFDIMAGVSINLFIKSNSKKTKEDCKIFCFDSYGKRTEKYNFLNNNSSASIHWNELILENDFMPWRKMDSSILNYNKYISLVDIYLLSTPCIRTHNDNELVSFDAFRSRFNQHYLFKAFDVRFVNFDLGKIGRSRIKVMKELINQNNVALIFQRGFPSVNPATPFITNIIADQGAVRPGTTSTSTLAPLYLYSESEGQRTLNFNHTEKNLRNPNLNMKFVNQMAKIIGLQFTLEKENVENSFAPIDILDYIYAVLNSPSYLFKYKEYLKIDFPRIPYPKNIEIFWNLVKLGGELRQLHLFESSKINHFITKFPNSGFNIVEKCVYQNNKVIINESQCFEGVPEIAWNFYIGGYQPAQKWLKDRKGRELTSLDIIYYQKIIVALVETDKLMKEIDKIEID